MAIDGEYGVGKAADVLGDYRQESLDIIGLPETRRDGLSQFGKVGYVVSCSGACGDKGDRKKDQGRVGNQKDYSSSCRTPIGIHQRTIPEGELEAAWSCEGCYVLSHL